MRILKSSCPSSQKCWNCKKDLPKDRLHFIWKYDSQRILYVLFTQRIPNFFFIKAQSHQFINPLCWTPALQGRATLRSLIISQKTACPGDWALSPNTIRQATVRWLGKDCDRLFLALGTPGRPRHWMMTSSLLMTAVAFNNRSLLSTRLSVSLGWLPPTSFVFEEKIMTV